MYRGEEKKIHALPRFAVREKFIYLASERSHSSVPADISADPRVSLPVMQRGDLSLRSLARIV
jgi:hypothetical protein